MAHIMTQHTDVNCPVGPIGPTGRLKAWGRLCLGLLLLWGFIFELAPRLQQNVPFLQQIADYVNASGIEATALYYTEVEVVGDSTRSMQNTIRLYVDQKKE